MSLMRDEQQKLGIFAPNKLCSRQTVNRSEIPHYAHIILDSCSTLKLTT